MTTLVDATPLHAETQSPTAPLRPIRVAIAGLGRPGLVHAAVAAAIPNVELVGLAETRAAHRRELRGVGFSAPVFERLSTLLSRAQPEALIVAAPPQERPGCVREALGAGVAVLAERPIASALDEAESLALFSRQREVAFASAHALVFHPVFAEARTTFAAGALGAVRRVRCSTYRSRVFDNARQAALAAQGAAGGVLAHEAIDALFYLIEVFGIPREVRATALRLFGPLEDELHIMMTLASGAEVGLDASWSVPGYPTPATVLEFEGDNGKLLASDDALELDILEPRIGYRMGHARLGLADLPQRARFDLDGEASYLLDAAFLAWVAGGEPPVHRIDRAMRALRVMEAIYASARAGGAPVPLVTS